VDRAATGSYAEPDEGDGSVSTRSNVLRVVCAVLLAGLAARPGFGAYQEDLFQRLWADHLPRFCLYTQLIPDGDYGLYTTPTAREYEKIYGPAFRHMHHYCFGLEKSYKASLEEDEQQRTSLYRESVGEYDYVLQRTTDDFVLKPDIYFHKGNSLEVLGAYADAVSAYTAALALKSDYVAAYVGLSNCFEVLGDPGRALSIVETGLRYSPDSEDLLRRRSTLVSQVGTVVPRE